MWFISSCPGHLHALLLSDLSTSFSCCRSTAETVSIDPLRKAVLRFKDMGIIFETSEAGVAVADSGRLQELTMDLVEFCR